MVQRDKPDLEILGGELDALAQKDALGNNDD